jgi:hypothetical protein
MFEFLDKTKAIGMHVFAAINLDNLLQFGPEEMNLAVIVYRQVHIETSIQNVSAAVVQLTMSRDSVRRIKIDVDVFEVQRQHVYSAKFYC